MLVGGGAFEGVSYLSGSSVVDGGGIEVVRAGEVAEDDGRWEEGLLPAGRRELLGNESKDPKFTHSNSSHADFISFDLIPPLTPDL